MDSEIEKKTCPKCGNPDCDVHDEYCFNCGTDLKNCCINESCNEFDVELPGDFCYCPSCGQKTFFYEQGYIQPVEFKKET